ncbi:fimbrial assembly protein [Trinickia violacea]|uniref:Fimbrial assembly protein n=1 Tax=Trinickia violacea TaxID=2571746 RepID=A0A4P8IQI6_9BURK|nr:fimbrial assembly protein [Trinickia violacea]QCP51232.1 fimbrial assembly protein [Trinickia violacea]
MTAQRLWKLRGSAQSTHGRRAHLGGFNLLPYRQRNARRARRRCLIECLVAVLIGCAAVTAWVGWEALERAGLDAKRDALELTLASLGVPLAEYRRLEGQRADLRKRTALAQKLVEPRARLLDLVDALSRETYPGIVLRELKQTDREVTLIASATDSDASSAWLARLNGARGIQSVDVADLRHVAALPGNDGFGVGSAIEFAAHLRWDGAAAKPAEETKRRGDHKGGAR